MHGIESVDDSLATTRPHRNPTVSALQPLSARLSTVLSREADVYRVGVAGGKGPLREGNGRRIAAGVREATPPGN
jgi:hypothetical protein